jgi:hypothetical protein
MALDLLVEATPQRALYSPPFRASRPFVDVNLTLGERLDQFDDYLSAPDDAKPFGYEYELDFGPDVLKAEHELGLEFAENYYDHEAQIWSTSHHKISMFGVYSQCLRGTYIDCGGTFDAVIDDAC